MINGAVSSPVHLRRGPRTARLRRGRRPAGAAVVPSSAPASRHCTGRIPVMKVAALLFLTLRDRLRSHAVHRVAHLLARSAAWA
ncbi:hypothetical protein QJS66_14600 [Kocuria rhizophila]|nr:hypothetical protein QJS66_14600 [Kocuria rhizophila]